MRISAVVASVLLGLASAANAAEAQAMSRQSTAIPAQSLDSALRALANERGFHIVYLPEVVNSLRTQGAVGLLTRDEALTKILSGTGLAFRYLDDDTVTIARVTAGVTQNIRTDGEARQFRLAQVQSAQEEGRVRASPAAGSEAEESKEDIEEILVRGARTSTATKMNVSVLEIPQNIQVLSAKFIEDIGADLLEDALRHVAGVSVGGNFRGWDYFRIRGFSGIAYIDGLRSEELGLNAEVFGIERLEVMKGPSSALYGDGLMSGMVNIVTKRPKQEAFLDTSIAAGSYDFSEATLDFGGSLNSAKTIYARLPVVYRENGTFVDSIDGLKRIYLAPSLTWDIGDDTKLTLLTRYTKDRNELEFPLPASGTLLPNINGNIPLDRFTGDGNDPGMTKQTEKTAGYEFTHRFSESFSVRQNLRYRDRESDWDGLLYSLSWRPDMRTLNRYAYYDETRIKQFTVDTGVELQFQTGPIRHRMTTGMDFSHITTAGMSDAFFGNDVSIDLFNPVNNGAPANVSPPASSAVLSTKVQSRGFYVQDQVLLTDRFSLMLGGRYDTVSAGRAVGSTDPDDAQMLSVDAFVPNAGMSYEIRPGVFAFLNYSEAFKGQGQFYSSRISGGNADPEEGVNYEAGVKLGLLENRVNGTFSVYELTRRNVVQPDFAMPGFYTISGEQRSRGVEFDGQFLLTPQWELVANIGITDAEVVEDNTLLVGSRLPNVPKEVLGLWSRYTFQEGMLAGLSLSLGGTYYGAREGANVTAAAGSLFELPSYTLINSNIAYQRDKLRFMLSVNNLFDEEYYSGSASLLAVLPGTPRSLHFTVGWSL